MHPLLHKRISDRWLQWPAGVCSAVAAIFVLYLLSFGPVLKIFAGKASAVFQMPTGVYVAYDPVFKTFDAMPQSLQDAYNRYLDLWIDVQH